MAKKRKTGFALAQQKFNAAMEEQTVEKLHIADKDPSPVNINNAVVAVENDKYLALEEKDRIVQEIKNSFITRFNFENCPADYQSLKSEAIFLAKINQSSFLLMAQRLLKIRDEELYIEEYSDFREFIANEIELARSTVYNYIDLIKYFGVQTFGHETVKPSKLIPALPLMKADIPDKDYIKSRFIEVAKDENISARHIKTEADEYKVKYGIVKEKQSAGRVKVLKKAVKALGDLPEKELSDLKAIIIDLNYRYKLDMLK